MTTASKLRLEGAGWALLVAFLGLLSILALWFGDLFRKLPSLDWSDIVLKGTLLIFAGTYLAGISVAYLSSKVWKLNHAGLLWEHAILPSAMWFIALIIYINIRLTAKENLIYDDLFWVTIIFSIFVILYGMIIRGHLLVIQKENELTQLVAAKKP